MNLEIILKLTPKNTTIYHALYTCYVPLNPECETDIVLLNSLFSLPF